MKNRLTADDLLELLAERHATDVFVSECKNGPTWGSAMRRLDAWALRTTWKPWTTIGYEIKVSRSDFAQDEKWFEYLKYCHLFFFVCPSGLIRVQDLPPGVGLIWANQGGTGLRIKYAAKAHEPDYKELCMLMSYVLMNRLKKTDGVDQADHRVAEYAAKLRAEVAASEARHELAYFVAEHIRLRMRDADDKLAEAKRLMCQIWEFDRLLEQRGLTWVPSKNAWGAYGAVSEVERLAGCVEEGLLGEMRQIARRLTDAAARIEKRVDNLGDP